MSIDKGKAAASWRDRWKAEGFLPDSETEQSYTFTYLGATHQAERVKAIPVNWPDRCVEALILAVLPSGGFWELEKFRSGRVAHRGSTCYWV